MANLPKVLDEPYPGVGYNGNCKKSQDFTLKKSPYQGAKCSYRVFAWQIHQKFGMNPTLEWGIMGIVRKPRISHLKRAPIKCKVFL